MSTTTFFFFFIPLLALILLGVNLVFAPHKPYQEKDSTFECGFHSFLGQNRTQFSISFFIFALLFLLFDLEILLMYPYAVSAYTNSIYGLVIMLVFFIALTLGFAFEINKNALKIDSRQMFTIKNWFNLAQFIPKGNKFVALNIFSGLFILNKFKVKNIIYRSGNKKISSTSIYCGNINWTFKKQLRMSEDRFFSLSNQKEDLMDKNLKVSRRLNEKIFNANWEYDFWSKIQKKVTRTEMNYISALRKREVLERLKKDSDFEPDSISNVIKNIKNSIAPKDSLRRTAMRNSFLSKTSEGFVVENNSELEAAKKKKELNPEGQTPTEFVAELQSMDLPSFIDDLD